MTTSSDATTVHKTGHATFGEWQKHHATQSRLGLEGPFGSPLPLARTFVAAPHATPSQK
jgi:hypothetical protein